MPLLLFTRNKNLYYRTTSQKARVATEGKVHKTHNESGMTHKRVGVAKKHCPKVMALTSSRA